LSASLLTSFQQFTCFSHEIFRNLTNSGVPHFVYFIAFPRKNRLKYQKTSNTDDARRAGFFCGFWVYI